MGNVQNSLPIIDATYSGSWLRRPRVQIAACIILCYALVLVLPQFIEIPGRFTRTSTSMLDHLLQGRFDVDPEIVGQEGFARGGRVYAYWGPVPAILRLPVTILPDWRERDFTIPYCMIALICMEAVKLWTVRFVFRSYPTIPHTLARPIYLVVALSGAQTCFLRFSVFQEVCLWAGLFGAIFVAAAIVAQHRGLGECERIVMAFAAGAALLTRVSTGIGLIVAFGLHLLVEMIGNRARWRAQVRRSSLSMVILAAAGLVTAWINYSRWGDPLTFADYRFYLLNDQFPDRVARMARYGLFNLERIPFGTAYYFLPIWVLHAADGQLLFDAARLRLVDSTELPPSSFFLTDPLLLVLGGIALSRWLRRESPIRRQGGAIAVGLAVPPLFMLTAISMCFRYRMDFYPLIEFLAFSGLAMMGQGGPALRLRWLWALAIISILSSATVSLAYLLGEVGPGQQFIGQGLGRYYLSRLATFPL